MDSVRSQLESLILNLDQRIDIQREALRRYLDQSSAQLAELKLQRKQLARMLDELEQNGESDELAKAESPKAEKATSTQVDGPRPPASAFILETLKKNSGPGMGGSQLQALAKAAGYSKDAFDKARTRLRDSGQIAMTDGRWAIAGQKDIKVFNAA